MRTTTPALTIAILIVVLAPAAGTGAQSQAPQTPQTTPPIQPVPPPPSPEAPPPSTPAAAKRWQPYLSLNSAFDTNIDHNKDDMDSLGGAVGLGIHYRDDPDDPVWEFNAEVAGHSYTNTTRWDRFSQKLNASYEHDLPGRWSFDTAGEISLKGSSEDREISDQYVVVPRIAYRITSQNRVRIYGALRARRYDDNPDRNAFNRYVGVEFTERATGNRRWEVDLRYEVNETESPRQHYVRWTFGTAYSFLLPAANRFEVEVRYRMQRYPFRVVEVDDIDVQRRDHRWIPRVIWTRPLRPGVHLRVGYTRETRSSNDLDREFSANLLSFGVVRSW